MSTELPFPATHVYSGHASAVCAEPGADDSENSFFSHCSGFFMRTQHGLSPHVHMAPALPHRSCHCSKSSVPLTSTRLAQRSCEGSRGLGLAELQRRIASYSFLICKGPEAPGQTLTRHRQDVDLNQRGASYVLCPLPLSWAAGEQGYLCSS